MLQTDLLSKLNPAGSGLIYSAFVGHYENVEALAVAVDTDQSAYVTGQHRADIAPTVPIVPPNVPPSAVSDHSGCFSRRFGGGANDAFVMKISASGLSILYSSYLGGADEDSGHGIAVDRNQNISM